LLRSDDDATDSDAFVAQNPNTYASSAKTTSPTMRKLSTSEN